MRRALWFAGGFTWGVLTGWWLRGPVDVDTGR